MRLSLQVFIFLRIYSVVFFMLPPKLPQLSFVTFGRKSPNHSDRGDGQLPLFVGGDATHS